jgi:hypothetical protein
MSASRIPVRAPSCERDVHGHGGLPDAALSRCHGDEIPHARERLQPMLDGVRDDRALDDYRDRCASGDGRAVRRDGGAELARGARDRVAARNFDSPAAVLRRDRERRPSRAERPTRLWNDELSEMLREQRCRELGHDLGRLRGAGIVT